MSQSKTSHSFLASAARAITTTFAPSEPTIKSKGKGKGKEEKVSRDFKGCMNCRVRRKKCEGPEQPTIYPNGPCANCRTLRYTCLGYPGLQPDWARTESDVSGKKKDSMRYEELETQMKLWTKSKPKNSSEMLDLSKYLQPGISPNLTPEEMVAHEGRVRLHASLTGKSKAVPASTVSTTRQRALSAASAEPSTSSSRRALHVSRERTVNEATKRRGSATSEYSHNMHVFSSRPSKPVQRAPSKPPVSSPPKQRASMATYTMQVPQSTMVVPTISVNPYAYSVPASTHVSHSTAPVWHGSDDSLLYPSPYIAPRAYSSGTSEYSAASRESTPPNSRRSVTSSFAHTPKTPYPSAANTIIQAHQHQMLPQYTAYGSHGQSDSTSFYQSSSEPNYNFPTSYPVQTNSYTHGRTTGTYDQYPDWY